MWTRSGGLSERITEVVEKDDSDDGCGEDDREFSVKTIGNVSSWVFDEDEVGRRSDEVRTSVNSVFGVVISVVLLWKGFKDVGCLLNVKHLGLRGQRWWRALYHFRSCRELDKFCSGSQVFSPVE